MFERFKPQQTEENISQEVQAPNALISRRNFLILGAGVASLVAAERVGVPIVEDWYSDKLAEMSNDDFIRHFKDKLSRLRVGASFAPEQFGISLHDKGHENSNYHRAQTALSYGVDTLGMRDIRLGVRWNNSVDAKDSIDFSLYRDFVDYLLERDVNICMDLGYKVQRWPEQHPPRHIEEAGILLPRGEEVDIDTDLGKRALEHTQRLTSYLRSEYGSDAFPIIQVENEPFQQFGEYEHTLSHEYMVTSMDIVERDFPSAGLLVNAGGAENIDKLIGFLKYAVKRNPERRDRLISGQDVHLDNPNSNLVVKALGLDTITTGEIMHDKFGWYKDQVKKMGVRNEASEVQVEDYGDMKDPLYKLTGLKKAFIRGMKVINLGEGEQKVDFRLWGLEDNSILTHEQPERQETYLRNELLQEIIQLGRIA